jgi:molybdate/tungstate transport system substrate-binding protein
MSFKKLNILLILFASIIISACSPEQKPSKNNPKKNKIIVFHAGSLSVPLLKIKEAYKKLNPNTEVILEAAGSRACARKITDLKKQCDLMVSADYKVIDNLLIPKYADWNIKFATNQLSIVYNEKSKFASQINTDNWYNILMKRDVICGTSNPNDDPCGYRTVLMLKLANLYYKTPDLYRMVTTKGKIIVRPKETDLIALLDANAIDYMFIYKSIAIQHKLKHIDLPDQINLGNPKYSDFYKKADMQISGKAPGSFITQIGAPIVYGVTIPKNAPDKETAVKFLQFMLSDKGLKIIKDSGQKPIIPSETNTYSKIPKELQKYAKPE